MMKRFMFLAAAGIGAMAAWVACSTSSDSTTTTAPATLAASVVSPVGPYANTVTYRGQGLIADGFGGYDLQTELCGASNGAEADGPYILWVLTATRATKADITGPWGSAGMTKMGGGAFHYVSAWYDPSTLSGHVTATYDGSSTNAQLVISHGCPPLTEAGWCSPGFWMNATDAAWALTGYSRTSLFNGTVYPAFYGATLSGDPMLTVVFTTTGGTYKGAPVPGTLGYPMNAFNAAAAFLTNHIPGYSYSYDAMISGSSETCPIDHFGHFKATP